MVTTPPPYSCPPDGLLGEGGTAIGLVIDGEIVIVLPGFPIGGVDVERVVPGRPGVGIE